MKKRLFSIILAVAVVLSISAAYTPETRAAVTDGWNAASSNIEWLVDTSGFGTLYIRRANQNSNAHISNTSIGGAPWNKHNTQVRFIDIEDGVSEIGDAAFANFSKVTHVEIKGNVTRIGKDAFRGCSLLEGFLAGGGLQEFLNPASAIKSKTFSGLATIDDRAFFNCYELKSLCIPDVTVLGSSNNSSAEVFTGCRSLWDIRTPHGGTDLRNRVLMDNHVLVQMNNANPPVPFRVIKSPVNLAARVGAGNEYMLSSSITRIDIEAFSYLRGRGQQVTGASWDSAYSANITNEISGI